MPLEALYMYSETKHAIIQCRIIKELDIIIHVPFINSCPRHVHYYQQVIHVHAIKDLNPLPQFSRLGTLCPTLLLLVCSFHGIGVSWVSFSSFLSVC